MTRIRSGHDTVEGRARSGSVPPRVPRGTTNDEQAQLTSSLSVTPPLDDSQSPCRLAICRAQQSPLVQTDENDLSFAPELKRAFELNANLKEQARYAEAERRVAVQQRDVLQAMLTDNERREQRKHGELLQARAEIQHLKECLDDCKERIFKMQPLEHMTDSDIAEHYRTLCESISDWTDSQFGDYDNPLSTLDACLGSEIPARLIQEYLIQCNLMGVVQKYPMAACAMITHLILRHVHQSVLRVDLCFPSLDSKCEEFILFIANAMKRNEPRRGLKASLTLIVETY